MVFVSLHKTAAFSSFSFDRTFRPSAKRSFHCIFRFPASISYTFGENFSVFAQLPECHRAGCRHIQRIDSAGHGNAHPVIAFRHRVCCQSFSFCSQNDCQFFILPQTRIVKRNGIIRKGHSRCAKAQTVKKSHSFPRPCILPIQPGPTS